MTCIIGIQAQGKVWIGGDSAGVDVGSLAVSNRSDPKVFRNGPYIIGFTSSFRMGQLLQYSDLPVPDTWDVNKFMVTTFIDAVREIGERGGYIGKDSEGREDFGTFIVGFEDKMYYIDSDLQVGIHNDGLAACGCGEGFALGSVWSLRQNSPSMAPINLIRNGLEAAAYHSGGVRPPFVILST